MDARMENGCIIQSIKKELMRSTNSLKILHHIKRIASVKNLRNAVKNQFKYEILNFNIRGSLEGKLI